MLQVDISKSAYCEQTTMTSLRESEDAVGSDNTVSPVPSWSAGLARTGGFYQDGDWYNVNISRYKEMYFKIININDLTLFQKDAPGA